MLVVVVQGWPSPRLPIIANSPAWPGATSGHCQYYNQYQLHHQSSTSCFWPWPVLLLVPTSRTTSLGYQLLATLGHCLKNHLGLAQGLPCLNPVIAIILSPLLSCNLTEAAQSYANFVTGVYKALSSVKERVKRKNVYQNHHSNSISWLLRLSPGY